MVVGGDYPFLVWAIMGLLALISITNALWLKPVYLIFMGISYVLGTINISILLSIVFYFFMLPVGIILRIIGRDSMLRQFEPHAKSYKIIRSDFPKDRLERPF